MAAPDARSRIFMKRCFLHYALAAGLLLATTAHGAPTQVSADAGEVKDLLYTTGSGGTAVVYAATMGGGVYKSTTSGTTWSGLPGLPAHYVYRLAVSPLSAALYAATESGLFRSADSGATWTQLSFDPTTAVAVDPGSSGSDTVMIGVPGMGAVLVTNANATPTFTRVSTGLDSTEVTKIEYQTNNTAVAVLACNYQDVTPPYKEGNYGGLFLTTTNGSSWSALPLLSLNPDTGVATPTKCASDVATNETTIVATSYDPLYNQGFVQTSSSPYSSWSVTTPGNPNKGDIFGATAVRRDRNTATTFWAGSAQVGVWKSTDSGFNWVQQTATADIQAFTGINALETIPGGTNVIAGIRGLGVSTASTATGNQTWTQATGLTADRVRSLTNHATGAPDTYYVALEKGGVQKSVNAGTSWTPLNLGFDFVYTYDTDDSIRSAQAIAAHPSDTSIVAVGLRSAGLYTLTGGTTWARVGAGAANSFTGPVDHKPQSLAITSGGKTYYTLFDSGATTPGGLFSGSSPTTMGTTNKPIYESNPELGVAPGAYRVVISPNNPQRVYLVMYDSEPYRSTDGSTFARVLVSHEGWMRIAFWDIAERPGSQSTVVGSTNKGIFRSTDGGANFARVSATGLTDLNLSSIAYSSDGRLFGGTLSGGYFCSKDDGTTWTAVALGALPSAPVREVRFMNGQIHWLTDGGGIYKSTPATDCP